LERAQGVETRYQVRNRAGGSPLKAWLDAQEDRRQAENALTENRLEQLDNHIVLVKAMGGGGWKRAGDVQDRAGASE
jgi:outer membrane protein TolC